MKKTLIAFMALLVIVPPAFSETRVGVSMAQMDDVFLAPAGLYQRAGENTSGTHGAV